MSAIRHLHRLSRFALHPRAFSTAPAGPKTETILGVRVDESKISEAVLRAISLDNASRSECRKARKRGIIERFRRSESDTGSPEVQIAILTDRIADLTGHVQMHKQDKMNKRRLVMMVHKRRRLMKYLLRESTERYVSLIKELGLRPSSVFSKDVSLGAKKAPVPRLHTV